MNRKNFIIDTLNDKIQPKKKIRFSDHTRIIQNVQLQLIDTAFFLLIFLKFCSLFLCFVSLTLLNRMKFDSNFQTEEEKEKKSSFCEIINFIKEHKTTSGENNNLRLSFDTF